MAEEEADAEFETAGIVARVQELCLELARDNASSSCDEVTRLNCNLSAWSSKEERKTMRRKLRRLARAASRGDVRRHCRREARKRILDKGSTEYGNDLEERRNSCALARSFARRFARRETRRAARAAARRAVRKARREASITFQQPVRDDDDDDESINDSEVSCMTEGSDVSEVSAFSCTSGKSGFSVGSEMTPESPDSRTSEEEFDVVAPLTSLCRRVIRDRYTIDEISQFSPFFHQLLQFVPP